MANNYNSDGSGAWGDPRVLNTWGAGVPTPGVARSLRSFYQVSFPPPDLSPKPIPFYPPNENVPKFADVFIAATGYVRPADRTPASNPPTDFQGS